MKNHIRRTGGFNLIFILLWGVQEIWPEFCFRSKMDSISAFNLLVDISELLA